MADRTGIFLKVAAVRVNYPMSSNGNILLKDGVTHAGIAIQQDKNRLLWAE